jgi:hypothetical protein
MSRPPTIGEMRPPSPCRAIKKYPKQSYALGGLEFVASNLGFWSGGGVSGDGCRPIGLTQQYVTTRQASSMRAVPQLAEQSGSMDRRSSVRLD